MSRPSMTALLAVLAIAGYQHRDKLAEMLGGAVGRGAGVPGEGGRSGGMAGGPTTGGLAGGAGGGGIGGMLSGGLQDLLDRFRQSGHGETAESWVKQGPNRPVQPRDLEAALGSETLDSIAQQTGLSREDIVARLSRDLPDAVDRYTPDGRVPDA
jgi:uncharacterized protein YidB (DUF937 family)